MSSVEYHRLARTGAHRWWRLVAGSAFIVVAGAVLALVLALIFTVAAVIAGRSGVAGSPPTLGPLADLAMTFLVIGLLLPVTQLAAWWIQRRPPGTLSSVTGRLRWRRLGTCLLLATGAVGLSLGGALALGAATGADTGLGDRLAAPASIAAALAVLLLVVPVQAAAEEYLMRGWLLQGVGAWFRRPWAPILVQALVFAALHGWGTPWGFADLTAFGLVAGWLTVRTGGLEAAVALHVMNNLFGAGLAAAYGDLGMDETAADMPWQMAVADVTVLIAYAVVVHLIFRSRSEPPLPACYRPRPNQTGDRRIALKDNATTANFERPHHA
ncbi:CPBP family intramembrane glutamic endopeptidase [Actinoplanes sp. NPDC026619]|uniref:CPBP family intramembrane glutamic endopeptidase n=1 Tax=Actinoplanes sp. NPDC026619 TaxID=3155798 RepID=UPI00340E3DF7